VACSGRILTTAISPAGHNATIYEYRQGSYSGFPKTYYKGGFENYEQYLEASKQVSKKPIRPLFSLLKHVPMLTKATLHVAWDILFVCYKITSNY
jgi:hypothetical protein